MFSSTPSCLFCTGNTSKRRKWWERILCACRPNPCCVSRKKSQRSSSCCLLSPMACSAMHAPWKNWKQRWHRSVLFLFFLLLLMGSGDSSVVRVPDLWSKGRRFKSLLERQENFLLHGQLSVLTLISVSIPPLCYHSSKDPSHSAKSAGGRLQLNTHTPYICGFAWSDMEHGCMVYTGLAPRQLQFHVAPAMPALSVRHFGGHSKTLCKKLVTHVTPRASAESLLKRVENSAI